MGQCDLYKAIIRKKYRRVAHQTASNLTYVMPQIKFMWQGLILVPRSCNATTTQTLQHVMNLYGLSRVSVSGPIRALMAVASTEGNHVWEAHVRPLVDARRVHKNVRGP